VGGSGGRERVAAGGVVVDGGGGSGDELAVAVTMFTHVVTATPGSVLTDRCFLKGYGYLV
jgi:predicted Rossmann-fold nucleotide-binding protein